MKQAKLLFLLIAALAFIRNDIDETLRGRLSIAASNYSIASRIISDTIAAGLIKLEDSSKSRKYAQYIPIWA